MTASNCSKPPIRHSRTPASLRFGPRPTASHFSTASRSNRFHELGSRTMNTCFAARICLGVVALFLSSAKMFAEPGGPLLQLETKIPLGDVKGRIDHMAFDPIRHRLFVAELGNDSVGVIDLRTRKVIKVIAALKAPQGIGYH